MKIKSDGDGVFYKNTVMLYLMTIAKYVFPLLLFPYLTRVLTPQYYGVITYMTSVMTYFGYIIDFGFNFSATRRIAIDKDDKDKVCIVLSNVLYAKVTLAILGFVIFLVMTPFVPILKENFLTGIFYYLSTAINLLLPDFLYRGLENMQFITIRYVIAKVITTALTFILVRGPENIVWVPILNAVGTFAAVAFTWNHIFKVLGYRLHRPAVRTAVDLTKESTTFFVSTFASTALTATNTFVMGLVKMPATDIAYWGVAFQIITIVMALFEPIFTSIYPRMAATRNFSLVKKIILVVQPIIVIGIIVAYIIAPVAIKIVAGKGYDSAIPVFRYLLAVIFFTFPAQMIGFPVLGVLGKDRLVTRSTLITACVHIIGLVLLIKFNCFTLINVAVLRSFSEAVLLILRGFYLYNSRKSLVVNRA